MGRQAHLLVGPERACTIGRSREATAPTEATMSRSWWRAGRSWRTSIDGWFRGSGGSSAGEPQAGAGRLWVASKVVTASPCLSERGCGRLQASTPNQIWQSGMAQIRTLWPKVWRKLRIRNPPTEDSAKSDQTGDHQGRRSGFRGNE